MTATVIAAGPSEGRVGLFERVGDVRALSVLRIVLGPIAIAHLWPFLQDARAGVSYDDHFWQPYVSGAPHLSGDLWAVLLWVGTVIAVNMQTAYLSPPVAMSAYYLRNVVPQWSLSTIYRGMADYMVIQVFVLIVLLLFPKIALWLPHFVR